MVRRSVALALVGSAGGVTRSKRRLGRSGCLAVLAVLVVVAAAIGSGCADGTTTPQTQLGSHREVIRGTATVDGSSFDARFLGAVVLRGGLVTPCQDSLPPVVNGRYAITVLADSASRGCGTVGARVVLWTFIHNTFLYSVNSVPWPATSRALSFGARFSSSTPAGAAPTTAEFTGEAFGRNGLPLPAGTRIEAYVGGTRCGIASVRNSSAFTGYVLAVVGPDAVAGCTRGARLTFRIDGRPAADTSVVNTPPGQQAALDLQVR